MSLIQYERKYRTSQFMKQNEENDFQGTSRQNAVMMLAIQETSRCGAVMTLESKIHVYELR